MNILVTGGNGFIGSNFIDYIISEELFDVICNVDKGTSISSPWIDEKYDSNEKYIKLKMDICDLPKTTVHQEFDFDYCVHFAAESHVDRSLEDISPFIKTNIEGTLAVAEFCATNDITMIHISTDEVYGHLETLDQHIFTPQSPLAPRNPYAASKASAEHMLRAFGNTEPSFKYLIIRPSNAYGRNQDNSKLIPKIIQSLYAGDAMPIYAKGEFYREWTLVYDLCSNIYNIMSMDTDCGEVFNITSMELISNFDLYMMIVDEMRTHVPSLEAHINFIPDPRGSAHDKIYSMANSTQYDFMKLKAGIKMLVNNFYNSQENGAG
jgi:dTDP-glucose 4,6-dehydratase